MCGAQWIKPWACFVFCRVIWPVVLGCVWCAVDQEALEQLPRSSFVLCMPIPPVPPLLASPVPRGLAALLVPFLPSPLPLASPASSAGGLPQTSALLPVVWSPPHSASAPFSWSWPVFILMLPSGPSSVLDLVSELRQSCLSWVLNS